MLVPEAPALYLGQSRGAHRPMVIVVISRPAEVHGNTVLSGMRRCDQAFRQREYDAHRKSSAS